MKERREEGTPTYPATAKERAESRGTALPTFRIRPLPPLGFCLWECRCISERGRFAGGYGLCACHPKMRAEATGKSSRRHRRDLHLRSRRESAAPPTVSAPLGLLWCCRWSASAGIGGGSLFFCLEPRDLFFFGVYASRGTPRKNGQRLLFFFGKVTAASNQLSLCQRINSLHVDVLIG